MFNRSPFNLLNDQLLQNTAFVLLDPILRCYSLIYHKDKSNLIITSGNFKSRQVNKERKHFLSEICYYQSVQIFLVAFFVGAIETF